MPTVIVPTSRVTTASGLVSLALVLLPFFGRWIDPIRPLPPLAKDAGLSDLTVRLLSFIASPIPRLWMLPTGIALILIAAVTGMVGIVRSTKGRSRTIAWIMLLAIPISVIMAVILEDVMPEFIR
jgi:hypothetical protein